MQYLGHAYAKYYLWFIWNSYLTGHPVFLLAKTGNPKLLHTWFVIFICDQQINIILMEN